MKPNNPNPKNANLFACKICDFMTSKESNYKTHLTTRKHSNLSNPNNLMPDNSSKVHTCKCGKIFKHLSTLCTHKKKCTTVTDPTVTDPTVIDTDDSTEESKVENNNKVIIELLIKESSDMKNIVLEIMKSNSELQKQNSDIQQKMFEMCKTNTTTINSHNNNKTFNLQFFLNEQCKDAMNISDFANSFDLQLSDLESVGELGYVEGIAKIFVDKLNSMDIYKRPIHCSDAKREILYVKDDNKWEKEERSNPKIRYAIKTISFRNMKLANLWSDTHPESKDGDSHMNDIYMKLIKESTGGNGEISVNEDKIIRRIAKNILIEKI
jgi:hypothetical protein